MTARARYLLGIDPASRCSYYCVVIVVLLCPLHGTARDLPLKEVVTKQPATHTGTRRHELRER